MKLRYLGLGLGGLALAGIALLPVPDSVEEARKMSVAPDMDLSSYPQTAPSQPVDLVFLHHSVGGHLLAEPGDKNSQASSPHPNGGGLRKLLEQNNYRVNEATYGSRLGEHTDLFDWLPKFRDDMDAILATGLQDARLPEGRRNRVVVFKSCYPNNEFLDRGAAPGQATGPELTVENAKATLRAVLAELKKREDTLFVYFTAPPIAPKAWPEPLWKWSVKKLLGKPTTSEKLGSSAALAREFNNWTKAPDGWLAGYPHRNVVVFDFYDLLTDGGKSNLSRYPTGDGSDSHPSSTGNAKSAAAFVPFLNRALHRAGVAATEVVGQAAPAAVPAAGTVEAAAPRTDG